MTPRNFFLATAMAALTGLAALPALAAEHEVQMLNRGEAGPMVFEPAFIRAEPGDVIRFLPTDKSHNVESIKEILPEGVEVFKSRINDAFDLTVTEAGLYGVKCTPHLGMGMVALIQVGEGPFDLETAQTVKLPKKARERLDEAIAQVN
ncbi:pseudoazurin [Paracoccus siganidrum]|uniref:Pseudoazurin n=1 Tax=Paracoccus siganidrum TaxID=1276757 RepID=A0A419A556_9RHOB|nr:pseudoazurin [Paracoccus siganidrum]RMC35239.1 pseudoazurin [Paracoccus siganidrum]